LVSWCAYQIPEIALKASLTYRAKIKHEMNAYEHFKSAGLFNGLNALIMRNRNHHTSIHQS
jgi:long-chain fatty acid transport protein